jgi:hypothetical protein
MSRRERREERKLITNSRIADLFNEFSPSQIMAPSGPSLNKQGSFWYQCWFA